MKVKSYFLTLWNIIDPLYYRCSRLTYIEAHPKENIFRVRLTRYKGRPVMLSDGTRIEKNDTLLKIHLHNLELLREIHAIANEIKKGKIILDRVQRSLPGLALYLQNHPRRSEIKGIVGITLLSKGSERLGFEVVPVVSFWYKLLKWFTFLPIYTFSESGTVQLFKKRTPVYLFMSKQKLLERYSRY